MQNSFITQSLFICKQQMDIQNENNQIEQEAKETDANADLQSIQQMFGALNIGGSNELDLQTIKKLEKATEQPQSCRKVVQNGGIPLFVNLLKHQNPYYVYEAIFAIGNISEQSCSYRDQMISLGVINILVQVLQTHLINPDWMKFGAWALANICRGKPLPPFSSVGQGVEFICSLLKNNLIDDPSSIQDCLWATAVHTQKQRKMLKIIKDIQLTPNLINFSNHPQIAISIPALKIIGQMGAGDVSCTEQILKYGVVNQLQTLIGSPNRIIRREASWTLSNIAAGTKDQVRKLFQPPVLMSKLLELFSNDMEDVRTEISYIFSNICWGGDAQEVMQFYSSTNILSYYKNILAFYANKYPQKITISIVYGVQTQIQMQPNEQKLIKTVLNCMKPIIEFGYKHKHMPNNNLLKSFVDGNIVQILETIKIHEKDQFMDLCEWLLKKYHQIITWYGL